MCLTGSPLKGRCDSPSNYKSSQACGCRPERQREPKSFRQQSLFLLTNSVALVIIHYPKTTVESIERTSKKSVSGFLLARVCKSRLCLQLTGHLSNACSILFSKLSVKLGSHWKWYIYISKSFFE